MSAEVVRTLESIYDRTPSPSNDVVRWEGGYRMGGGGGVVGG